MNLMITLALALLLASSSWASGERRSLDGIWHFTTDAAQVEQSATTWDRLPVPGNWDTVNAYSPHVGKGWYRREFIVPPEWKSRRVRLHFEAVYETAEVSLNGRALGRHEGGYTPFEFDVTDAPSNGCAR